MLIPQGVVSLVFEDRFPSFLFSLFPKYYYYFFVLRKKPD